MHEVLGSAVIERVFRPVEEAPDETGERILAAALAEFLQIGIRRARLEEIARRAGVARATVHRRFTSKDQLVAAVLAREARDGLERARTVVDPEPTVPDKIAAGFVFALDYSRHGTLSPLLHNDPLPLFPALTTHGEPLIALIRTFLIRLLHGASKVDDAVHMPGADALARLIVSYCLAPDMTLGLHDPAAAADFARDHLAPLITGTHRRPPGPVPSGAS
jgi:AcrR family transcriptional regulator